MNAVLCREGIILPHINLSIVPAKALFLCSTSMRRFAIRGLPYMTAAQQGEKMVMKKQTK